MTIICNIFRFLGKEFLDRSLIQQRSAQNSQHFVSALVQFEVVLNDEECEALRHFLSQYLGTSEVDFLMDYTLMKAFGLKPKELVEKLAEEYRLPTRLVKSRLKSLRKKVNDLHLYAAYLTQAA